jgi:hypothetical protein
VFCLLNVKEEEGGKANKGRPENEYERGQKMMRRDVICKILI